jgi:predicted O-methyltransferase YrrM
MRRSFSQFRHDQPDMFRETWSAVDDYVNGLLGPSDPALDAALAASAAAGLPPHHVSPAQGKLLFLLARLRGARRILEVGTLGGYSTIWLARALPADGTLITLESDGKHAAVARANFSRAGLDHVVELRLGPASDTLPQLLADKRAPFDLIFIDADKQSTLEYFEWSLRMSRTGTLIVMDNVVRDGAILDPASSDPNVAGVRRLIERLAREPRVSVTVIQTVGSKGYDGVAIALVTGDG